MSINAFTKEEFVAAIKKAKNGEAPKFDTKEIVRRSVSGSTFRTFKKEDIGGEKPSDRFRPAMETFIENNFASIIDIDNQDGWDKIVNKASAFLIEEYNLPGKNTPMQAGIAKKLVNLVFKMLIRHKDIDAKTVKRLEPFLHVPLDTYTLQGIRLLAKEFNIPKGKGMGWDELNNGDVYLSIQKWIREKCAQHGCYPIHYELAAWDAAH